MSLLVVLVVVVVVVVVVGIEEPMVVMDREGSTLCNIDSKTGNDTQS